MNSMILSWQKNKQENKKTTDSQEKRPINRMYLFAAAAFILAAICSGVGLRLVRVNGPSMEPTLHHNDWVIALPRAYQKDVPERGDVILLRRPSLTQGYIVKRVIGLPGEQVEIRNGMVFVNNTKVDDPFMVEDFRESMEPLLVEPGCYFVLGDNRTVSKDSRHWEDPFVHREELCGKVWYMIFPQIRKLS